MSKEMIVTGGKVIVDDEDFHYLQDRKWYVDNRKNGSKYVKRKRGEYLHRIIMKPPVGMCIDHINGDGCDNRKENLRVCTQSQNMRNRRMSKNNKSGAIGVLWNKISNKWVVNLRVGSFKSFEEAKEAYSKASVKLFGEYFGRSEERCQ
jgi:hypothetical protein